ncbi:hypothetical protein ACFFHM_02335 [Halalkalibacter kiskunsagensis]|uniref:Uncharacterized protein n=1 Tax=Halalkalibacter kiskunsagensis TaxID=1548599 RepID=A0ABV6K7X4_9BACI
MNKIEEEKIKRLQECASDAEAEQEQKKLMTEIAILSERERIQEAEFAPTSCWESEKE